jgi:iron complex transport system substrate-binding protein
MAPNATETVFELGRGDLLVGRSDYCDYPPAVRDLPSFGGYMNPDLEAIALLDPDLVLIQGRPVKLIAFLEERGLDYLPLEMNDLASIDEGISALGAVLQAEEQAAALRANVDEELRAVREAVESLERPKVLLVIGRAANDLNTVSTVGGGAFLTEIVRMAGGENIYGDAATDYPEASKETIVLEQPEVILEFHAGAELTEARKQDLVDDWADLGPLPAVENGRIHIVTESYSLRPGPRVGKTARLLARLLHPEADVPAP